MNKPTALLLTLLALPCALMAGTGSGNSPSGVWVDTRTGNLPALTVTMRRVRPEALANAVQGTDIDEELRVNTTNLAVLSNQPEIQGERNPSLFGTKIARGGLVADGLSPLLFEVSGNGSQPGTTYEVTLSSVGPGTYNGDLNSKLQVLSANSCVAGTRFTLPSQSSRAYLVLSPLKPEDLTTTNPYLSSYAPVVVDMKVWDVASRSKPVATFRFGIRKPPVVLVHGYDSDNGTWSPEFKFKLQIDRGYDFVLPVEYGTENGKQSNTFDSLKVLAGVLYGRLATNIESYDFQPQNDWKKDWAFTRYDAVGHSQGGVLLRMLCSSELVGGGKASSWGFLPFQNKYNSFRGRFRRVVTIGSPHAGSTMCELALKLKDATGLSWGAALANVFEGTLFKPERTFQEKFRVGSDSDLDVINKTLQCDPKARLHFVWTTVDNGQAPGHPGFNHLFYKALYLDKQTPLVGTLTPGQVVAPNGADGVVSVESQGKNWTTPSSTVSGDYCHAVLGITQTGGQAVGDHVRDLLNGSASQFGPVNIPAGVTAAMETARVQIGYHLGPDIVAANRIEFREDKGWVSTPAVILPKASRSLAVTLSGASADKSLNFTLSPPAGESPNGPVTWSALVYGPNGVTTDGLTLQTSGTYGEQLALTVSGAIQGQVVLGASFPSTSGTTIVGTPSVALSLPEGVNLTGITLQPATIALHQGTKVPVAAWGAYDDGTSGLLFTKPANTTYTSSNQSVAMVDAGGEVSLLAVGTATITATYNGTYSAQAAVTVLGDAPTITSPDTSSGTVGTAFNYQITASGSPTSYGASPLPDGLSMNATTGLISGNPTTETATDLQVTATDANGAGLKVVRLTITGTPGAPTDIGLSAAAISENKPTGTVVGQFATTDPNPLDTFTYQLVSGTGATDNALFSIAGNQLLTATVLNHATQPSVSIRVRSTDSSGLSVEKAIVLPVLAPPAITRQPDSRQVFAGDDVTFFVEATGVEPLSYQWNVDGEAIPDANSRVLELPGTTLADSGNYTVTVSNGDGSATSNAVSLVVDAASYGKWASTLPQAVASAVLEPNGDYNGDGIPNYLDFAFGVQSGLEPATSAQPYITSDAAGFLLIYREANGIAPPVYRIMKSTNMTAWQQHLPAPVDVTRTDKGAYTEVQVRVPSGSSKLFLKVQVSGQ